MSSNVEGKHHIFVIGKYRHPLFQRYRVAAESLAQDHQLVEATVEGLFETQYEQRLKEIINEFGGSFTQSKPSSPLIYAETEDSVLYFLNEKRFFEWAYKRFRYEDNTREIFYNRVGSKMYQQVKMTSGRSYCALSVGVGETRETVQLELFDEECPTLVKNFLELMKNPRFNGHLVHRIKPGSWIQAGDLVDSSGLHSEAAAGGFLRHESFRILHDRPGLLGMANHGKDTIGSQFYITLRALPFLDGKSVIFGRVISGMRPVLTMSKMETRNERPVHDVKIFAEDAHESTTGDQN